MGTRGAAAAGTAPAARTPALVGVVWALLAVNVLGFFEKEDLAIPLPRPFAQLVTMGALVLAFALALLLNRRVRVRPSAFLLLLSLLLVISIASSLRWESGAGALFRCFRLTVFVATLWLLSCWWNGGLDLVRFHLRALGGILGVVLLGVAVAPGAAFSAAGGRLVGSLWPIPPPQVGQYAAIVAGLVILLWVTRHLEGRTAVLVVAVALAMLVLSHTRTALAGLVGGLVVAGLSLVPTSARARRTIAVGTVVGALAAVALGPLLLRWLQRGQDADQIANLTGRALVWDRLLAENREPAVQLFGVGLTDKSFDGLAIDNSWLAVYHEQGWVGVAIVIAYLVTFLAVAVLRPPSPARACAVFLVAYCLVASYTEVGLGDASPYLLHLTVAASLLVGVRTAEPVAGVRAGARR